MDPLLFDFTAYLSSLCPGEQFSISVLTGGLVNVTVRATRTSPALETSLESIRNKPSFILKYAPGYIAAIGDNAPFSQFRQTIEARALRLFTSTPPFTELHERHPEVYVPRLLYHDEERYILVIEDLGDLQTVDKWIESTEELSSTKITSTAVSLGLFLADFHLCSTDGRTNSFKEQFKNEDAMDVVFSAAVEPVLGILQSYDISDAHDLYACVASDFNDARQDSHDHILCMGDLWTGSILVGENKIGVIDWEFATMGTPSQDVGQLGSSHAPPKLTLAAHLYNHTLIEGSEKYELFAKSMVVAYGRRLLTGEASWLAGEARREYFRGMWTIFGRELINMVTWGKRCACEEGKCRHSTAAVETGAAYIREAKEGCLDLDLDLFLKPQNQGVS